MKHRRHGTLLLWLLVGLLVVPLAGAMPTKGQLVTRGAVEFAGTGEAVFPSAAVFLGDTSNIGLSGTFPFARVCEYEWRVVEVGIDAPLFWTPYQTRGACFDQQNLTLAITPGADHSGWLGIHPRDGGRVVFTPEATAAVQPSPFYSLASPESDSASTQNREDDHRESADQPWFIHNMLEPTVAMSESGVAVQHGPGELKIKGADVEMRSDANATTYKTEDVSGEGPAHERMQRWLVITFSSGEVTITSEAAPFQIAAPSATVDFDGTAEFTVASGSITTEGNSRIAEAGRATLDGQLSALVSPTPRGDGLAIVFQGDARSVSLGSTRIAAPHNSESPPWDVILLGIGLASVAGGAAFLAVKKHAEAHPRAREARHNEEVTLAVLEEEAALADCAGEWDQAITLIAAARRVRPRDPDLALWLASCSYNKGDIEAALDYTEQAAILSRDGQGEYFAGLICARVGRMSEARAYMLRALEKDPQIAAEVNADAKSQDDPFRRLRADPEIARRLHESS